MTDLLTPKQIAASLKVSPSKVYGMLRSGELKKTTIGGNVRMKQEDFERYCNSLMGEDDLTKRAKQIMKEQNI